MKKLKCGVIGLGMGRGHLKVISDHPAVDVTAICDTDRARLDAVGKEFGVKGRFLDAETMLREAELDAVVVATPNKFHAPITIAALRRGIHVLCEKPMAMNTQEAVRMEREARKARRNLMINFSYRFSTMSYALKQQVDSGVIGDIYFGRTVWHRRRGIPGFGGWFSRKELSGGGPLIDLGVHRLDLALWLMGYPEPLTVSGSTFDYLASDRARREKKRYSVEDLACALIRFKNGATLIVEASWQLNIGEQEHMVTTLCGTKGGLTQKNVGGGYEFTAEIYCEEGGYLFTKKLDSATVNAPSSCVEFINSILEHRQPLATARQGIQVMRILDGIYRSARTGKEITLRGSGIE